MFLAHYALKAASGHVPRPRALAADVTAEVTEVKLLVLWLPLSRSGRSTARCLRMYEARGQPLSSFANSGVIP